jgi:hypothetical protein
MTILISNYPDEKEQVSRVLYEKGLSLQISLTREIRLRTTLFLL